MIETMKVMMRMAVMKMMMMMMSCWSWTGRVLESSTGPGTQGEKVQLMLSSALETHLAEGLEVERILLGPKGGQL